MAKQAKVFLIRGRVQGVGFRYFVLQQARALGLAGWVRNLSDGRVEAFVEGPRAELDAMASVLAEGPSLSRVDEVKWSDAAPSSAVGFVIRG